MAPRLSPSAEAPLAATGSPRQLVLNIWPGWGVGEVLSCIRAGFFPTAQVPLQLTASLAFLLMLVFSVFRNSA